MTIRRWATRMLAAVLLAGPPMAAGRAASAQTLDSLIAQTLSSSPRVVAAQRRADAARAASGSAGALEDPMLMLGLMNQPIRGSMEEMSMRVVGVSQMIPFPGKRPLERSLAERELAAALSDVEVTRRDVTAQVQEAYYELAFLDRSLDVLHENEQLLRQLVHGTESRYSAGAGEQIDVLEARVELARLAEEAAALVEARNAMLARLNAAADRALNTPIAEPRVPERIVRAAVATDAAEIRFASPAMGARVADSPLPPLDLLVERAVQENRELLAHDAVVSAQAARVELARKAHLPDVDISVQFGQRDGLADLFSAVVSLPLPVRRGTRQDRGIQEAEATQAALTAEHHALINDLTSELAEAYADAERARSQLALFVTSILPHGRAALESAAAAFQVGRADFETLLKNRATLYAYETAYQRALTDFAIEIAKLERLVGGEVL